MSILPNTSAIANAIAAPVYAVAAPLDPPHGTWVDYRQPTPDEAWIIYTPEITVETALAFVSIALKRPVVLAEAVTL